VFLRRSGRSTSGSDTVDRTGYSPIDLVLPPPDVLSGESRLYYYTALITRGSAIHSARSKPVPKSRGISLIA